MYFFVYREANYGDSRYRSLLKKMSINGKEWYINPVIMAQISEFWKIILVGSGSIPPTIDYQDENNTDLIIKGLDILHGMKFEPFDFVEMVQILDLFNSWLIQPENVINIMFLGITYNSEFDIYSRQENRCRQFRDFNEAMPILMNPNITLQEKFVVFFSCYDIDEIISEDIREKQLEVVNQLFQNKGISFLWKLSFLPELIKKEYGTDYPTDENIIDILLTIPEDVVSTFMIHICNQFSDEFIYYEEYLEKKNSSLYPIVSQIRDRDDFDFDAIIYEYQDR